MNDIEEYLIEIGESAIKIDGFDEAVVGLAESINGFALIYDYDMIIEILMRQMSYDCAIDYYSYNILGMGIGDCQPMFIIKKVLAFK